MTPNLEKFRCNGSIIRSFYGLTLEQLDILIKNDTILNCRLRLSPEGEAKVEECHQHQPNYQQKLLELYNYFRDSNMGLLLRIKKEKKCEMWQINRILAEIGPLEIEFIYSQNDPIFWELLQFITDQFSIKCKNPKLRILL